MTGTLQSLCAMTMKNSPKKTPCPKKTPATIEQEKKISEEDKTPKPTKPPAVIEMQKKLQKKKLTRLGTKPPRRNLQQKPNAKNLPSSNVRIIT